MTSLDDPSGSRAHQDGLMVITLPSEIDVSNGGQLKDAVARGLGNGTRVLVADAGGTTFCGCAGVRELLAAHHQAATHGVQFRVVASPAVLRILELSAADEVLETYPTMGAALDGQNGAIT